MTLTLCLSVWPTISLTRCSSINENGMSYITLAYFQVMAFNLKKTNKQKKQRRAQKQSY